MPSSPWTRTGARSPRRALRRRRSFAASSCGPLQGIPVLIKDTQDTAGLRTTYGSPLFADHVPATDQGSVARLRAAGAIILGKTNTPEWAAGGNTRNPVHGATGNPFDPSRSAAGSSGGSAVALACGMAPLASGSDTGGSLRNPAAYAGIVGMRPSYGLVASERRAFGWSSLSTDGPMARNVCGCGADAVGDGERRWPRSAGLHAARRDRARQRRALDLPAVSRSDQSFASPLPRISASRRPERAIRRVFRDRVARIAPLVGECREGTPDCSGADDAFAVLRAAMFVAMHGKTYRERPEMLGPNVRANVEEGLRYSLEDYARAATAQTRIYRSFQSFFERCDVLVSPTITLEPAAVDRTVSRRDRRRSRHRPISTGWRSPMASRWPATRR